MTKQTRCPNCQSIYKVTVPQLTVAQGMVCCPKCNERFNAVLHLKQPNINLPSDQAPRSHEQRAFFNRTKVISDDSILGLDILTLKVDHSNLDLHHYLNNLNYYHRNNVYCFPAQSPTQSREMAFQRKKRPQFAYYLMWGIINFSLFLLFIFQILWFNPQLLEQSQLSNLFFNKACALIQCETLDQRYTKLNVEHFKIERTLDNHTQISGILMNYNTESLKLPQLKIIMQKDEQYLERMISPAEYLAPSLHGISRIPARHPYSFKVTLLQQYDAKWQYEIQIVRP